MNKNDTAKIINNFEKRNIQASYYKNLDEAKSKILELMQSLLKVI
ncbi:MAG: hypothetical protein ACOCRK_11695 [bacterium]